MAKTCSTCEKGIKIIVINESDGKSILSDAFTFGCIVGAFWVNYEFLGDGIVLQIVMGIAFLVVSTGKGSRKIRHMTADEAREYFCPEHEDKPNE